MSFLADPLPALSQQRPHLYLQAVGRSQAGGRSLTLLSDIPCKQLPPTNYRAKLGVIPPQ